jgi:hypothetical protein
MSAAKIVINEFFWHSTIEPEPVYLSGAYWPGVLFIASVGVMGLSACDRLVLRLPNCSISIMLGGNYIDYGGSF